MIRPRALQHLAPAAVLVFALVLQPAFAHRASPREQVVEPPTRSGAQPDRERRLNVVFLQIDGEFTQFARRARVPGAAWGVIVDGALVHAGAAGHRELRSKAPVDASATVFRIASMTKSFTAMAILKLRDAGRLALDDPAERYIPEMRGLRYPSADSPRITIRHLLTHAAGFPEDNPWGDRQLSATEDELSRTLRAGILFSNAPGVAYEYSNLGFALLGRIVARVSGRSYREYMAAEILRPLGMPSTTFEPTEVAPGRLAHGYRWEDGGWTEEPSLRDGAFGPMGGMLTSVGDLSRFVAALLSAWPPRDAPGTAPIGRASLREMQQLHRFSGASASRDHASGSSTLTAGGYGFGLRVFQTCSFDHVVAHGGGLPGFGSLMQWVPDHGIGIVALGNLTYTGWSPVVSRALDLLAETGGVAARAPQPSPALVAARDAVSRLIIEWDDRLADRLAAGNLFLDQSRERRRRAIEELRAKLGACTAPRAFDRVENALRGGWTMTCERGRLAVAITLAPTVPARVQALTVRDAAGGAFVGPERCRR